MANLSQLRSQLLNDRQISGQEVEVIREYIREDGQLDIDDVKFLVGLLSEANSVCSEFDDVFFPALKDVILTDGRIGADEQFYLLKMLYSDGEIRDSELRFLEELRAEAEEITPAFETLYQNARTAHPTAWSTGGGR